MPAGPVYHSPITVSSGSESPHRTGSRGLRGRFIHGYSNRSSAVHPGFDFGGSSRMGSAPGHFRTGSGYSGFERQNSRVSGSRSHSQSHISISSDDNLDTPDARMLAELAEIKEGLARVEERIEIFS